MTQPQQPVNEDVGGVLKRVHLLGSATEELFNRVYGGLNRRKKITEAMEQLDKMDNDMPNPDQSSANVSDTATSNTSSNTSTPQKIHPQIPHQRLHRGRSVA